MSDKSKNLMLAGSAFFIVFTLIFRYCVSCFDMNLEVALTINCVFAIVVYLWLLLCLYKMGKGLVNVYSGFLLLSFLFFFGQHMVVMLGKANVALSYFRSILDGRIPNNNRVNTGYYILIIMLIVNAGVVCGLRFNSYKNATRRIINSKLYNMYTEKVAVVMLAVVALPTFYRYYIASRNTFELGYTASLEETATGMGVGMWICSFLSYFFLPAVYMLLISYKNSKKKYIVLLIYGIYAVLYLGSGSRFRLFESAIAILLIYNYVYRKIHLKDIVKLACLAFVGLFVFSVIRYSREVIRTTDDMGVLMTTVVYKILEEGILVGALMETGSTFQVIDVVLFRCPSMVDYSNGLSLLGAFLMCVPSLLRFGFNIDSVSTSKVFSPLYLTEIPIGMGSSFIAESYYNFGIGSLFFAFLLGLFIGNMLTTFNQQSDAANNFELYKYVYLSSLICFTIRTDMVSILRYYVLYVLFIQLVITFLYQCSPKYVANKS